MMLELTPDDVGYAAMPLFHTNSLMSGLRSGAGRRRLALPGPSLQRLSIPARCSTLRRDLVQLHGQGAHLRAGHAGAVPTTPTTPSGSRSATRVAAASIEAAATRFGMRIIDVFGSTEGGIALDRTGQRPPSSIGRLRQGIMVVDEEGTRRPAAVFDADGRLTNADRCVGEIVNTLGVGPFEGYYRNEEAMRRTTRNGWYWSGDLGYVDDDGWVYFAGRTSDWLRVDGENFPATPIEAIIGRHPDLLLASVYGVPEPDSGDQVMCALVLREGETSTAPRLPHGWTTSRTSARSGARGSSESARGAADDADQQGPHPHPCAREVPLGPCERRPRLRAGPGHVTVPILHEVRSRPACRVRGQRTGHRLGPREGCRGRPDCVPPRSWPALPAGLVSRRRCCLALALPAIALALRPKDDARATAGCGGLPVGRDRVGFRWTARRVHEPTGSLAPEPRTTEAERGTAVRWRAKDCTSRQLLDEATVDRHRALTSLVEELEAVDWYDQRVTATQDSGLADILAHNRDEEKEHASMTLEWLRRRDPGARRPPPHLLVHDRAGDRGRGGDRDSGRSGTGFDRLARNRQPERE